MSEIKQICKHEINWDEPEIIEVNDKRVVLQVSCIECYDYWQLEYENDYLAKADNKGILVFVMDFEQNTDGTYPEEQTTTGKEGSTT